MNEEDRINKVLYNNEIFNKYIVEKDWKLASERFPFEHHVELIKHAYDTKNSKVMNELIESANIRAKYRRIEVPYVVDIDIQESDTSYPYVENGFEII